MRFLSHLDMMRLWERAIRRARLPLRYSQGFHPHPRLSLASPLAVGMTADAEWLECEFVRPVEPAEVQRRLEGQLPCGVRLLSAHEAPWKAPALAARLRASAYELSLPEAQPEGVLEARANQFLQASTWVVEERHKERVRTVDLRQLVGDVQVAQGAGGQQVVRALLHHVGGRSARLETLLSALGIGPAVLIHRQWLVLDEVPAAAEAG